MFKKHSPLVTLLNEFGGKMRSFGFLTEQEKAEIPDLNLKQLKRMASYLKPFLLPLAIMFLIEALSSAIGLVPSILNKSIVDEALLKKDMKLLVILLGVSLGFAIFNYFVTNLGSYIRREIGWKMSINMKTKLFDKIIHMDHDFFKTNSTAEIKERLTSDVADITDAILEILPEVVSSISIFITAFSVMGAVDFRMIIAGLAIFPLEILPRRFQRKVNFSNREKIRELNIKGNSYLEETLSPNSSLLIKLFSKEKETCGHYKEIYQEKYNLSKRQQKNGHFFKLVLLVLSKINSSLVYLVAGWLLIILGNDSISIGSITMCITLCSRLKSPFNMVMNSKAELQKGLAAFNRVLEYMDRENKIKVPINGVREDILNGDIQFSHVAFSYDESTPVLKDINFTLPSSSTFAIVGPSGSGKSSLVNLLPRIYDCTEGAIKFNGVDIKEIDLAYLRSNLALVTQETYLFNGTILENLRYANPNASVEEIHEACKNAHIHDFIMSTDKGYDTEVGISGLKLSGGEKQRISIARALLKNPKLLILDESTASLDSINESEIQDALDRLLVGRTSIIIAHRLSTVLNADQILVLKDGQIVEQGHHKDLIKLDGVYKQLFDTQFKKVLENVA